MRRDVFGNEDEKSWDVFFLLRWVQELTWLEVFSNKRWSVECEVQVWSAKCKGVMCLLSYLVCSVMNDTDVEVYIYIYCFYICVFIWCGVIIWFGVTVLTKTIAWQPTYVWGFYFGNTRLDVLHWAPGSRAVSCSSGQQHCNSFQENKHYFFKKKQVLKFCAALVQVIVLVQALCKLCSIK